MTAKQQKKSAKRQTRKKTKSETENSLVEAESVTIEEGRTGRLARRIQRRENDDSAVLLTRETE